MKKLLLFLLFALPAFGQGSQRIGQATVNAGGYVKVLSGAAITTCSYNISLQCLTPTTVYQDPALMVPQTNPFFADANGNYTYFAAAGTQLLEQVCSPGTTCGIQVVVVGGGGAGSTVKINGSTVSIPNFNSLVPSADAGYTALPFKISGSNVIVEAPFGLPPPIGNVTANTVYSNPSIVTAGSSGNASFQSFRTTMQTTGELDCDFLNSSGAPASAVHPCFDYTWFTPGNSAFSQGVFGFGSMVWMFGATGGLPVQGTYDSFQMPDPPTTVNKVCKVTHNGAGSTGVTYYIRFLDANSGYTNYASCSDSGGYPSPDSSHVNTIVWWQPQPVDGFGGSASNMLLARGTPTTIIDLHGSGVLSTLSSCAFAGTFASPPTDPSCTYADNGAASTTTLSSLAGLFYNGIGNSTPKVITNQLFTLQQGAYAGGGVQSPGRIVTQALSDPSAPTVVVNNTGANTCTYGIVVHDSTVNGVTNPSAFTTVMNCNNSSQNVSISWTITSVGCYSVDLLKGDSSHSLALGLPCTGSNTSGGFGTPNPYVFTDTGQSTTGGYFATNNTADIISSGSIFAIAGSGIIEGKFVEATSNVTAPFIIANAGAGTGEATLSAGDSTHTGALNWYEHDQVTRKAFCGSDLDSSNDISCTNLILSGAFNFVSPIKSAGTTVITSGVVDAGKLGATTAVAPAAALAAGGSTGYVLTQGSPDTWSLPTQLYDHGGTAHAPWHTVVDTCTLGTSCAVTLAGSAVFTSSSTYTCTVEDATAAAATSVTKASGSAFTITGTGTDVLWYNCTGY